MPVLMGVLMRKFLVVSCLLIFAGLDAADSEALSVRRIAALWKDGDQDLAQSQMERFLQEYPGSAFTDTILVMLGSSYLEEQNFSKALDAYKRIQRTDLADSVREPRLQAMLQLGHYQSIIQELAGRMHSSPDAGSAIYYAKALTARAKQMQDSAERRDLLLEAKECLAALNLAEQKNEAQIMYAELQRALGQLSEAATSYRDLAARMPERKEEFLWEVMRLESEFDKSAALLTLRQVQDVNGPRAPEAAFLEAVMLAEADDPQLLLERAERLSSKIATARRPLLDYLIGRAHHLRQDSRRAIDALDRYLQNETETSHDKQALLMAIQSSQKLEEMGALERYMQRFVSDYPEDPQLVKALLMQAELYRSRGDLSKAYQLFERIATNYPKHELCDQVRFNQLHVAKELDAPTVLRRSCQRFLEQYADSSFVPEVHALLVDASLRRVKAATEGQKALQQDLLDDVRQALAAKVRDELRSQYLLIAGETLHQLGQHDKAQETLLQYSRDFPKSEQLYSAHFLLALSYLEQENYSEYIRHGEQVLTLKPDFSEQARLRHNLAAAYFKMEDFENAAAHLFELVGQKSRELDRNNLLWITNYGFAQLGDRERPHLPLSLQFPKELDLAQQLEEAYALLWERLQEENAEPLSLSENSPLEYVILAWTSTLAGLKRDEERLRVIRILSDAQDAHSDFAWQSASLSKFALAAALEAVGSLEDAKEGYASVMRSKAGHEATSLAIARLQWARLSYYLMAPEKRRLDNPEMGELLSQLQLLQVNKSLLTEPIHLEAALDYIAFTVDSSPEEDREARLLAMLQACKQDFTSTEDIVARNYHHLRQQQAAKNALFQNYLMLIDASIAYLQACTDPQRDTALKLDHRYQAARSMFQGLSESKPGVTGYVADRAYRGLNAMEQDQALTEGPAYGESVPQAAPQWRAL